MATVTAHSYTVGWVTAVDTELSAAREMLDEIHPPLPRAPGDDNSYTFGRVGAHNIVIACLPLGRIGKVPAAIVVKDMLRSFPSLQFGLLVGIGGGIPTKEMDMRLGDIAVSKPGYNDGGVVQYDYGQTVKKGRFIRSGTLNQPPSLLLTALDNIRERHGRGVRGYVRTLKNVLQNTENRFSSPGAKNDVLYHSHYDHVGDRPSCDRCRISKTKDRALRVDPYPRVFYGTIASADRVIRHGPTRDKVGKEIGAICFEMEAAGLMNDFPCLVIRGICDYSDTHKNYLWQPYAALTAAAYAKDLLEIVPPESGQHDHDSAMLLASARRMDFVAEEGHSLETPETIKSVRSSVSALHSFFVIDIKVLQSPSVALGRLVTDVRAPWDEYCADAPNPDESQVGISPETLLRDLLSDLNAAAFTSKLRNLLSTSLVTDNIKGTVESIIGKSYYLTNPRKWLDHVCDSSQVRQWIEEMIKIEWDIWLVVGIHTIPTTMAATIPDTRSRDPLTSGKEIVVAVQYRQVKFEWLDGQDKLASHLEPSAHRWEPLLLTKASAETDEDLESDILDVYLQTHVDFTDLAFSDGVFEQCGKILVF